MRADAKDLATVLSSRRRATGPLRNNHMPESNGRRFPVALEQSRELGAAAFSHLVDLGRRLRRTTNVQDHVSRSLFRRIDAKRHLSPPCPVDRRENLAETLAVLLRDVHNSEVQIEFIVRWLPAMEFQGNPSVELVLELFETTLEVMEEFLILKGFERIEVGHRGLPDLPIGPEVHGRSAQTLPASTVVG